MLSKTPAARALWDVCSLGDLSTPDDEDAAAGLGDMGIPLQRFWARHDDGDDDGARSPYCYSPVARLIDDAGIETSASSPSSHVWASAVPVEKRHPFAVLDSVDAQRHHNDALTSLILDGICTGRFEEWQVPDKATLRADAIERQARYAGYASEKREARLGGSKKRKSA